VPDRGPDHSGVIESRVEPGDDRSGAARLAGGPDRLGEQAGGAAGRPRAAAAEPDRAEDRGGERGADDGDQRVQALEQQGLALDLRVAEPGSFFLVAVGAFLGGADVGEGEFLFAGQEAGAGGEDCGQLAVDGVELADVVTTCWLRRVA
jgi:hypothetical protein